MGRDGRGGKGSTLLEKKVFRPEYGKKGGYVCLLPRHGLKGISKKQKPLSKEYGYDGVRMGRSCGHEWEGRRKAKRRRPAQCQLREERDGEEGIAPPDCSFTVTGVKLP